MPAVEANINALWVSGQTAKGTVATVPIKRLPWAGGDIGVARSDGSENYSDLDRFGSNFDYVDTLVGSGSPQVFAQPDVLSYMCYLFFGGESVGAAVSGVLPHTFTPQAAGSKYCTFWKRVGANQIIRQRFADCKPTSLRIEGSTANKLVKATMGVTSLDPGEVIAADPAVNLGTESPFAYTEGVGTFTIDGVAFSGQSQFAVVWDDALTPYYGDAVVPIDFTPGNAQITLDGITVLLDANGVAEYNKIIYGTASPSATTKPIRTLPSNGSYTFTLTRGSAGTLRSFQFTCNNIKWSPDLAIPPNPDGGPIELALAGSMRKTGSTSTSIVINSTDAAYTI